MPALIAISYSVNSAANLQFIKSAKFDSMRFVICSKNGKMAGGERNGLAIKIGVADS